MKKISKSDRLSKLNNKINSFVRSAPRASTATAGAGTDSNRAEPGEAEDKSGGQLEPAQAGRNQTGADDEQRRAQVRAAARRGEPDQVEEIEKIFQENKKIKRENLDDRLKEIEDLEEELRLLVEENNQMRRISEDKMKK